MTTIFDDLDDGLSARPVRAGVDLDRTHIANGGSATQVLVACPKCNGSGLWRRGYSLGGFGDRACFRCDGKGKVSVRSAAASKAKATRQANEQSALETFWRDHRDVGAFLEANGSWSEFFRSLHTQLVEGKALSERQVAAVRSAMAKVEAGRAARAAQRSASAPKVDVAQIEALFAKARASGLKRPVFRADGLEVSLAPVTGKNAGALYVKAGSDYQGKIVGGSFLAVRTALGTTLGKLLEIAADPLGRAKLHGKLTGSCSCCGRELTDPVSVAAGIGPICAGKWGL